ncbi:hypothetical protein B0A53_03109 [Rhodotorula sp. CCFEE 5036]|nr:hypothetical protein B0A53_03109 [Rhodotorula sp. CCFEE 5036]
MTINDVLADLRAILAPSGLSSSEIEAGLAPALEQYHQTHFTPAASPGGGLITLANKVGRDEYLEPTEGKVFRFDALSGTASPTESSSSYTSPFSAETESARSTLDKLLSTHVSNHYTSGVAAVYVLPDPAFPPESESEPEPEPAAPAVAVDVVEEALATDVEGTDAAVAETAAETAQVVTEVLDQETVETARAEGEADADADAAQTEEAPQVATTDDASTIEGANASAPAAGVEAPQQTEAETMAGQDDDKMDLASPAPPVSSTATDETAPAAEEEEEQKVGADEKTAAPAKQPRPSNQFGLYFVGHKYSPNNYWTGRWRSTYSLDQATGVLEGTAQVNIHYYEQGNVQLSTTFKSTSHLGATPSPEAVIASIKSSESAFQRQLGETYSELADASFRGLRRALPKTRSKLDWDRAVGYKLGRELGAGGGQTA